MRVISRSQFKISIEVEWAGREDYDIIQNFHFSSDRKRMGLLLRNGSKYIFYLKGADSVMCDLLGDITQMKFASEHCKNEAELGLRTLVFACRVLSSEQVKQWIGIFE